MQISSNNRQNNMEYEQWNVLEGWNKDEKFQLLQVLKVNGSRNMMTLCEAFPDKSADQIRVALAYYRKKAWRHPIIADRKKKERTDVNSLPSIPLACWAKRITDSNSYEELKTETATALHLIAECENFPSPLSMGNIDLRSVYHLIANAVEGKSLPDEALSNVVINKCIMETALTSKTFIRNVVLRSIINNINMADKHHVNAFTKSSRNHELLSAAHLANQNNYNPLNIPEEFLRPTT